MWSAARRSASVRGASSGNPGTAPIRRPGCVLHETDASAIVRHDVPTSGTEGNGQVHELTPNPDSRGPAGRRVGRARGGHAAPAARLTDEPASAAAPALRGPPRRRVLRPLPCHVCLVDPRHTSHRSAGPPDRGRHARSRSRAPRRRTSRSSRRCSTAPAPRLGERRAARVDRRRRPVAPIAGSLGDRYDRRRVMIVSDLAGAADVRRDRVRPHPGRAARADGRRRDRGGAVLPGRERRHPEPDAGRRPRRGRTAWSASGRTFGGLVGPVVGGFLYGTVGPARGVRVNAVSFVASAALIATVRGRFSEQRDGSARRCHGGLPVRRHGRRSCARWRSGGRCS